LPAKVVIDTNLVVQAYTFFPKHRQHSSYPAPYQLVDAFHQGYLLWLWNEDILVEYRLTLEDADYRRRRAVHGGIVDMALYDRDERLLRFAGEHTALSMAAMAEARRLIASPGRSLSLQDLDDAVFLATAAVGQADYLMSQDADILTMGSTYQHARILPWVQVLQAVGYPVGAP
jgi:predicted nucleic acid-binding protein